MAEQESLVGPGSATSGRRGAALAETQVVALGSSGSSDVEDIDFEPASPIAFRSILEHDALPAGRDMRQHVLFELRAAPRGPSATTSSAVVAGRRSPINLCLCLDRSGSMEGDPLAYAKKACEEVVNRLGPDDVLSVVTFAEQADVLLPATKGAEKEPIKKSLGRIAIGNRTNLYKGLETAIEQVFAGRSQSTLNRILLLSDGEPTAGLKDFQSIVTLITDRRRDAIKVSGLGFGPAYNEELIAALARRSGGNYYYISRPELLPGVFAVELDGLLRTSIRNVRLRLHFAEGIAPRQVYANELQNIGKRLFEVGLVDLEAGEAVNSLWELDIAPHVAAKFRAAIAEVEYEVCETGRRERHSDDVLMEFTHRPHGVARTPHARVQAEVRLMDAARQLDQTMIGVRSNRLTAGEALGDLERTQRLLIESGSTHQAGAIRRAIDGIRAGEQVEKTLIGAIVPIDQGRRA